MFFLDSRLRGLATEAEADVFGEIVTVRFYVPDPVIAKVSLGLKPIAGDVRLLGTFRYSVMPPSGFHMLVSRVRPQSTVAATAGFVGTWIGRWQGGQDGGLVVEEGDGPSVRATYFWGVAPLIGIRYPGGVVVRGASVADDTLRLELPNGAQVRYRLSPDQGTLSAEYSRQGRVSRGVFERVIGQPARAGAR